MATLKKNGVPVSDAVHPTHDAPASEEEPNTAQQGRRDGPGAASGAPAPAPDPADVLRGLKSPKAVADVARLERAKADLAPSLKIAEAVQAEMDALLAEPENQAFVKTVRDLNFDLMYENIAAEPDYNHRTKVREQVNALQRLAESLSHVTDDAPGRLAREIRNLTVEALAAYPGLNYWREHPALGTKRPAAFKELKEHITYLIEQVASRFTPRLKSEDEQDFGFDVDRTLPPPSKPQISFDVFNYDQPRDAA